MVCFGRGVIVASAHWPVLDEASLWYPHFGPFQTQCHCRIRSLALFGRSVIVVSEQWWSVLDVCHCGIRSLARFGRSAIVVSWYLLFGRFWTQCHCGILSLARLDIASLWYPLFGGIRSLARCGHSIIVVSALWPVLDVVSL